MMGRVKELLLQGGRYPEVKPPSGFPSQPSQDKKLASTGSDDEEDGLERNEKGELVMKKYRNA